MIHGHLFKLKSERFEKLTGGSEVETGLISPVCWPGQTVYLGKRQVASSFSLSLRRSESPDWRVVAWLPTFWGLRATIRRAWGVGVGGTSAPRLHPSGARCSPCLPMLWPQLATSSPPEKPPSSWRPRVLDLPFLLLQPHRSCFLSYPSHP